uniref:Charged multivesicular body protein 7 n=1 Tax=Kalanchoe fedtschenkoi TaxID=63787 RepID=A0A7N0TUF0_KALFE
MAEDSVGEFIRKQVGGEWDEEAIATARFKAFSGQRTDWEPKYLFWKNLILDVARHLNLFIINPFEVKQSWFHRGGLTPLCLDQVLVQMCKDGDIVCMEDLLDPTSSHISILFRRALKIVRRPAPPDESLLESPLILMPLLKEKSADVVKILSQNHWTPSCIITKEMFQALCGGPNEASSILSYMSECGKARYIFIKKAEVIEGIKVSLSNNPVPRLMSLDYDVLHLTWTIERLQKQLDVIDQRYANFRSSAMTSLGCGNRITSVKHVREMKMASQSREKCILLLNRVEEVLSVIVNAESTKKVSEAIQIGARAMKENRISLTEVEHCLQELDEAVDSQKQITSIIELSQSNADIDEESIEEELLKLELEVVSEDVEPSTRKDELIAERKGNICTSLCDNISKLSISDTSTDSHGVPHLKNMEGSGQSELEAA